MDNASAEQGTMRMAVEDGIGWVIADHPARANALSAAMLRQMPEILAQLDDDPEVRVIIMRGAGERFISGADISEFKERFAAPAGEASRSFERDAFRAWERLSKPVVAMINGHCVGGGLMLALQADLRLSADHAKFGIPAARLGVGYGYDAVKTVVEQIGPLHAADILLTGRLFSAQEALAMGLVNRIMPIDALESDIRALARSLADNAPLTLRLIKRAIREVVRNPGGSESQPLKDMTAACMDSEDFREGARAFMEKRQPRFRGV